MHQTGTPEPSAAVPVTLGRRPLHPRHGLHAPRASTPARRPGSLRRTSTLDARRPDGLLGPLVQVGRARDLRTHEDGTWSPLGEASVASRVAYVEGFRLLELTSDPVRPELDALVGRSVSTGFRAAMVELVPDERERASLLHLLLDDLPGAALVSGFTLGAGGATFPEQPREVRLQIADLCAGFQRGGTIMDEVDAGRTPPVVTGPVAPPVLSDDPVGWHTLDPMGAHDMRRWRRLDVWPGADPESPVNVEIYFRDSHVDDDGVETVVHEYTVTAQVDPVDEVVVWSGATAHSLPWLECIEAEASGTRLRNRPLRGLRPAVREEFVGITTCTHLNDTMRMLEDVRALLPHLRLT